MAKMNRRQFLKTSALAGGAVLAGTAAGGKKSKAYGAVSSSQVSKGEITIPARRIPITDEADVIVIGGGPAGFGAATRAAQSGADTILIERFGGPGGNMTNAFMCDCPSSQPGLDTLLLNTLKDQNQLFNALKPYPALQGKPAYDGSRQRNFYPDIAAIIMLQIMQQNKVRFLFRTAFLDAVVHPGSTGSTIEAVIVENASGLQAIRGKVFLDCTGRGNVVVKSGAPYMKTADDLANGWPIPSSLMWKLSNVNFTEFLAYLPTDPSLAAKIAQARANGDINPTELFRPRPVGYGSRYKGHDTIDLCPLPSPGEALMECSVPYEWALNCADNGADASRAEWEMRNFIYAEWNFLKKYVPGFQNCYITGIAPLMGQRDSDRPIGEYVLTYDDLTNNRTFPDGVLSISGADPYKSGTVKFQIPYRAFLPQKIDNLLACGDCLSFEDSIRINLLKALPLSIIQGEVAGVSAAQAVKQGISVKEVQWTQLYTPSDYPVAFNLNSI